MCKKNNNSANEEIIDYLYNKYFANNKRKDSQDKKEISENENIDTSENE